MNTVTTRKIGRYTYVSVNGERIAIMERSPFTGDWCYGLAMKWMNGYKPPFTSTDRRTATAAAKIVASAYNERG